MSEAEEALPQEAAPINTLEESTPAIAASSSAVWPSPLVEDYNDAEWPNLDETDDKILEWTMKNKKLLVRTVTWNLCAKPPPPKAELQKTLLAKRYDANDLD